METSDYLLFGLLALVALLLAVIIFILLRRNSARQGTDLTLSTSTTIEESEVAAERPVFQEPPEADPLARYLQYLDTVCQSVEPLHDNEYTLKFSAWSLPYTLELATNTRHYDEPEDHRPLLRLYFTLYDDRSWEISDRGETTSTLDQLSENVQGEIDSFGRQIDKTTIGLSADGILQSRGENYLTFEQSLLDMREAAEAMDQQWTLRVWERAGLMPVTLEYAKGERLEFSGTGLRNQSPVGTEITRTFSLRQGTMVFQFEHTAPPSNEHREGSIYLVRDDPGIFDGKMPLYEFTGSANVTDVHLVTEGMWRDPHPDIGYHLELTPVGEWTCTILQPELGQSKGTFPHRAGLSSGAIVMGPFRTGTKPTRAQIQHDGSEQFQLQFTSVDGTHQTEMFTAEAQFHVEEHETDLRPGKEYVACAYGSGPWEIELTEGY